VDCYCISGLGADYRLFGRLNLPGVDLHDLPWLPPEKGEAIAQYAGRMKAGIRHDNPILLGVSFGGMMAIEIAKLYPSATVILISSIRNHRQRPRWMTLCGRLGLEVIIPRRNKPRRTSRSHSLRNWISPLENYLQGLETSEDHALYRDFRSHADRPFIRWAVGAILRWDNEWTPDSIYHLHGGRDRIFPLLPGDVTHILPEGGHFMVYNHADWVSRELAVILGRNPNCVDRQETDINL
jgi:pimeloyl-ACP methyl ester carboxylesterase